MLPTQTALGYISRLLGICPDASFTFLNTVNHYQMEGPLMLSYSAVPTLLPISPIHTKCAPAKSSTSCISYIVCISPPR